MRLISCYVYAFGALKDFSFDFSEGLNVVKQDNGWGKSTFATFIKAMFYGLAGTKQHTIDDNERKKYTPWNSNEKFGGSIVFEWGDEKYKIERFFGNKESEDTVRLTDAETGKEFPNNKNLGERLFGIDEEGFSFTTYFSQKDVEVKSNSSITSKFNSVCEVQDSATYDKAVKLLEDKSKEYFVRGGRGKIEDLKNKVRSIEYSIEKANSAVNTVKTLKESLISVTKEKEEISDKIKDLSICFEKAAKVEAEAVRRKRYDALSEKNRKNKEEVARINAVLNGNAFSQKEAESVEECISELNRISAQEELIEADLKEASKDIPQSKKHINFTLLYVISAMLLAAGAGVCFFNVIVGGVIAIIGAIALILSIVFAHSKKASEKAENAYLISVKDREKRLAVFREHKQNYVAALDKFFAGFNVRGNLGYTAKAELLKNYSARHNEISAEIEETDKEMAELLKEGVAEEQENNVSLSSLKGEQQVLNARLSEKIKEEENIKSRIKVLETESDALYDLENEKAQAIAERQDCEREYKVITDTLKYLKLANENLKRKYSFPLRESLNEYLKKIDGNVSAQIDTDFRVNIEEKGAERDSAYFSKGYRNLFEICKRFALIDVLYVGEKPFIILDDPFCNLDDEKVKSSLSLIKDLSGVYQIIYLVCHGSRAQING